MVGGVEHPRVGVEKIHVELREVAGKSAIPYPVQNLVKAAPLV